MTSKMLTISEEITILVDWFKSLKKLVEIGQTPEVYHLFKTQIMPAGHKIAGLSTRLGINNLYLLL